MAGVDSAAPILERRSRVQLFLDHGAQHLGRLSEIFEGHVAGEAVG